MSRSPWWRRLLWLLLVVVGAAAAGLAGFALARGRQPAAEQAVTRAAAQLRAAPGMSFTLQSEGVLSLQLAVDWRSRPHLMRVTGEVRSGSDTTAVSFWVDGVDLYVRDPTSGVWRLRRGGASLPDVAALLPENVANRLQAAAAGARPVGTARTDTGEVAWAYALPGQGRLLLRRGTLAPLLWESPVAGGGTLAVRWHGLKIPPGLQLPASVQLDAQPAP